LEQFNDDGLYKLFGRLENEFDTFSLNLFEFSISSEANGKELYD
jgi:hypothetical protein